AFKDAEKAIALSPAWPKGYFRKGRALLGLKKYALAEQCFVEVMKRDNDCVDAITELHKAKILQIMEKGYSKEHAEAAISNCSTVAEALNFLRVHGTSRLPERNDNDIFISDDESDVVWKAVNKPNVPQQAYDIKMDPNNPEGHNSLWIGNVQEDVTEKKLIQMFGNTSLYFGHPKYGFVQSPDHPAAICINGTKEKKNREKKENIRTAF
ncbi:hypothetical protein AVEN_31984-1, partial [Araneus ventricosus]